MTARPLTDAARRRRTRTKRLAAGAVGAVGLSAVALSAGPAGASAMVLSTTDNTATLAPGVSYENVTGLTSLGWLNASVLTVNMSGTGASLNLLPESTVTPGASANKTPSQLAAARGAVAAVNGDSVSTATASDWMTNGPQITGDQVLTNGAVTQGSTFSAPPVIGMTDSGIGQVENEVFSGTISDSSRSGLNPISLTGINTTGTVYGGANGSVLYNALFGSGTRSAAWTPTASTPVTEVAVANNVVQSVTTYTSTSGWVANPTGTTQLIDAEGTGATALAQLKTGDTISVSYGLKDPSSGAAENWNWAIGGDYDGSWLVQNGVARSADVSSGSNYNTGIGFSRDGKTAYLVSVTSAKTTLPELGQLMTQLGAYNAQAMESGGGVSMSGHLPGEATGAYSRLACNVSGARVSANCSPAAAGPMADAASGTGERADGDAVGVFTTSADGVAHTLMVGSAADPDYGIRAFNDSETPQLDVFPNSTLTLTDSAITGGWALDSGYATVADTATTSWSSSAGTMDAAGDLSSPAQSGPLTVTAAAGGATGTATVNVLSAPVTLTPTVSQLALAAPAASPAVRAAALGSFSSDEVSTPGFASEVQGGHATSAAAASSSTFTITGTDDNGYSAAIDPATVTFSYDPSVVTVTNSGGQVQVTPVGSGSTIITLTDGSAVAQIPVTVGSATMPTVQAPIAPHDRMVRSAPASATASQTGVATLADANIDGTAVTANALTAAVQDATAAGAKLVVLTGATEDGTSAEEQDALFALEAGGCDVLYDNDAVPSTLPSGSDVACLVLPGTGDRANGSLTAFTAQFGQGYGSETVGDTDIIGLDTSEGSLTASSTAQIAALAGELDTAAGTAAIKHVLVFSDYGTADPLNNSADIDTMANEDTMLNNVFQQLVAAGKDVTVLEAASRAAGVSRNAGVATVALPPLNGNAQSVPSSGLAAFDGWTELTVDDANSSTPVSADYEPLSNSVALTSPATLAPGASTTVTPTASQGAGTATLAYPAALNWSGAGVAVGSGSAAIAAARTAGDVAIFDPSTDVLTALANGSGTLTLTQDSVGGGTTQATVPVTVQSPSSGTAGGGSTPPSSGTGSSGTQPTSPSPSTGSGASGGTSSSGTSQTVAPTRTTAGTASTKPVTVTKATVATTKLAYTVDTTYLTVALKTSGAGKVSITALNRKLVVASVKNHAIGAARKLTLKLTLSKAARADLRKGSLKVAVTILFTATDKRTAKLTRTLTLKKNVVKKKATTKNKATAKTAVATTMGAAR